MRGFYPSGISQWQFGSIQDLFEVISRSGRWCIATFITGFRNPSDGDLFQLEQALLRKKVWLARSVSTVVWAMKTTFVIVDAQSMKNTDTTEQIGL